MKSHHLQQYDGPTGYYTKWDKSNKKTNMVWPYLHVKSKKQNKQRKQNENRPIDRYREKHTFAKRQGAEGRWNR